MTATNLKRVSYAVLTLPSILIYAGIIIFPIIFSVSLGFTQWGGGNTSQWVGLDNYLSILTDATFFQGLRNNFLILAISLFGQIPLGFIFAYIIYRKLIMGRHFFESMIFLPITISAIVVGILWNQIFSPSGLYTAIVRLILSDPTYILRVFEDQTFAIVPILFVILWMYTGIYMTIFIANLQKISPSIIEAAIIDGASERQILGRIILPSMLNVLFTTAVFAIAGSLKSFDFIFAMTGGGPAHYTEVIAIYMYMNTFRYNKYGFGSAVSIVIVLLSLGLISLLRSFFRPIERRYE